uniref:NF041680 family putative transposase n=1 Tax=Streptomyces sp. Tue6028 TaxID=2036037 RepID=UPI003D74C853
MSLLHRHVPRDAFAELSCLRTEFYACLTGRSDALFELADALLCVDGPARTLVELSLAPEHRRGHGALYGGLNCGRLDVARLRRALAGLPLPRTAEGRLVLAVDVSNWLRPDANTSPERLFCHTYGRGRGSAQMIPGWPYSFVAALEPGRTSWTAMLDVARLCPWDDEIAVTAVQVREVFQRLYVAGQWQIGDPPVLVVVDAGYDVTRLAFLLADLPVELLGRMRSDRVLYFPPPPQPEGKRGRKPKRGAEFKFEDPATQPVPSVTTLTDTTHFGKAVATAWDRLRPLLVRRSAWAEYPEGELPVIEGTAIRLQVDHLRGDRSPKPVWLWWSATGATAGDVDRLWQAFLRRFDLEHTFRMMKQALGWTAPKLREPTAADRWTWLVIA